MESKRALIPVPQNTEILETKCIKLDIPIDPPEYRQAFIGALVNLTKWFSWERDAQKKGVICARGFNDVLDSAITQLITDSETNNCEDEMPNFRQVDCNLEALLGGVWTVIYTLEQGCINDMVNIGIGGGGISITYNTGDSTTISDETEDATTRTNDLDAVWGGCLEVTEYVFETVNVFLDLLEVAGNAATAVSSIFKGANDTIKTASKDKNNNDIEIFEDVLIGNDGESNVDLPVDKTEPAKSIDPTRLIDIFGQILDAGVAIVRAGLTENYLENVAGKLFNILTCLPNNMRTTSAVTFTTEKMYDWSYELTSGNIQDIIVGVIIVAQDIAESVDFLSLLDLQDAFRQYTLGLYSPSATWNTIVDPCGGVTARWSQTFDFTISPHATWWTRIDTPPSGYSLPELTAWVSGRGWGNGRQFHINRQIEWSYIHVYFETANVDTFSVTYESVAGSGGGYVAAQNNLHLDYLNGTTYVSGWSVAPAQTTPNTYTKSTTITSRVMTGIRFQVSGYQRAGNNDPQGAQFIRSITLGGTGQNPFA